MSNTTILQIPMDKALKQKATLVASDYGFSSLQEIVRVIISKLAKKELVVSVTEEKEKTLSPKAEKRYMRMLEDYKNGKNFYTVNNGKELMKLLKE